MNRNSKTAAQTVGQMLVAKHPKGVDIASRVSHGIGGGKTMIQEGSANISLTFKVKNTTPVAQPFIIGNETGYGDVLTKVGGVRMLLTGGIQTMPLALDGEEFDASLLDSDLDINAIFDYVHENPTRVIGMNLQSHKADGSPDTSNYAGTLKSFFLPPFQDKKVTNLSLDRFVKAENFSSQFLKIDFRKMKFPFVLGKLNKQVMTIQPGTTMSITLIIGAQISDEQELYRIVKDYDSNVHPYTDQANCEC